MRPDLDRLLNVTAYRAFDIDPERRILAGSDESGSTQLAEIAPDGSVTALTALPGACTGRYVPGERTVVVSHDDGGNEQHQLSLLSLPVPGGGAAGHSDLVPLVRDPRYMHVLADVGPGWVCYATNRRDGVNFDPVIRDLATGAERPVVIGDHLLGGAALSPDGRWLALIVSSKVTANAEHIALVDLAADPGRERVRNVTPPDDPSMNGALHWLPDSSARGAPRRRAAARARLHRRGPDPAAGLGARLGRGGVLGHRRGSASTAPWRATATSCSPPRR